MRIIPPSRKGCIPWNKGKIMSQDFCEAIRLRQLGRKLSKETKLKMSLSHKGKNIGRKFSEEHKKKLSVSHLGQVSYWKGKKNPNAFGGRNFFPKYGESNPSKRPEIKKILSELKRGNKNPSWKGGITSLRNCIWNLNESKKWRKNIFIRDGFKCIECQSGGHIEAHHKYRFEYIYKEFLLAHSIYSPIEDIEVLLNLAKKYSPFWDIDNGETLCYKCHNKYRRKTNELELVEKIV